MATEPDPYRTLGLPRTATLAEVKAAYRRLAKANHPDAAGESALPRFLAIQAAYERLVTPTGRARATPAAPAKPRQPWEADPDRSDATRRAYGGRARGPAGASGTKPGSKTSGKASAGASSGTPAGGGSGSAPGSGTRSGTPKDPKKATLGSTSYDEADREAFEPDWVGASWYGTTSGTYWTINPKEYADPRKHGPEYQARARRASREAAETDPGQGSGLAGSTSADTGAADTAAAGAPEPASARAPDAGPDPTPRHTTSSWWDATSGPAADARDTAPPPRSAPRPRPAAQPRPAPRPTSTAAGSPGDGLSGIGRAMTMGGPPSIGWRIARAVIGWLPIALAIGWAAGEVSGCARYAATCDAGLQPIALGLQLLVIGLLLARPVVAGWAVIAAMVSLAVAVPATLFLTASAGSEAATVGPGFLGVALGAAWVVGIVGAILASRRQSFDATGPVS